MVGLKQVAALAAASYTAATHASAIPDASFSDLAGFAGGAPQPSTPASRHRSINKRQTAGGFIDTNAAPIVSDCGVAATFSLNTLGQLVVDDLVISMNPGTPFIPLRPISPPGSVTVTFSLNNGALTWANANFFGGQAGFCQDPSGQVYATFADPSVSYPANCAPVQLGPIIASTCQNSGGLSSSLTTSATTVPPPGTTVTTLGSTIVTTGPGGNLTTTVSSFATTLTPGPPFVEPTTSAVANGTLTLPPGLYTVAGFANPAGAVCSIVSESWIIGETSLLPAVATSSGI
ncbi:hypothetical protein CORC01_02469 [Colletotrichum orchidophilum]|uniref:DUF7908 domain-containing protein n=1 Tax=Colletotrichum orchidophilum TaxID=1209926 RepID=A0A1G4BL43_9PEZI|nr:uncharacterized protein CORC01_02469 [Colletotrichum orchidophilum]OHF02189.1 hypothetical protein CORC01_02469 [Colletotrichum orchidophilum]